jgi:5-methylcytosine-specific restriction endonuclease McrA
MERLFNLLNLTQIAKPLSREEGLKILERDQYRCQYCGLDGATSFENSLMMSVDFVTPRSRRGKKDTNNLVAACRPCNLIKGRRVFKSLDDAKAYVLQRREELRKDWQERTGNLRTGAARA